MFQDLIKKRLISHKHRASTSAPAGSNWKRPSSVFKKESNDDNTSENDKIRRDIFWLEDRSHRLRPHRSRWLCDPVSVVGTNLNSNSILRPKRYVGSGLVNLGNTCFLNSVLQLLLHTPYLVSYLMCGHHREARKRNPEKSKGNFDALELLIRLVRKTHGAKMKQQAVEPIEIARRIRYFGRMFKLGRQEDAHEFLIRVLESAQKSCLRIHHNMHPTSSGIVSETSAMYVVAVTHLSHIQICKKITNGIRYGLFGGYIQSHLSCPKCGYMSKTYDSFMDLSLEISSYDVNSVYDALSQFTETETLDRDNRWECSKCKRRVCATKGMSIHVAPPVLFLHLKRFTYGRHGEKIGKFVQFPERLCLDDYMSGHRSSGKKKRKKTKKEKAI